MCLWRTARSTTVLRATTCAVRSSARATKASQERSSRIRSPECSPQNSDRLRRVEPTHQEPGADRFCPPPAATHAALGVTWLAGLCAKVVPVTARRTQGPAPDVDGTRRDADSGTVRAALRQVEQETLRQTLRRSARRRSGRGCNLPRPWTSTCGRCRLCTGPGAR